MPSVISASKGPLVVVGIGTGFALVGAVPVAVTMSLGISSSATIIGVGFIGFGMLLIVPGLCWCVVIQLQSCYLMWKRRTTRNLYGQDETPELELTTGSNSYGGLKSTESDKDKTLPTPSLTTADDDVIR